MSEVVAIRPAAHSPVRAAGVSWKAVALPSEHGGWGMLGEPLLLGLTLAPTWAGGAIAAAGLAAFLARHPLKLALIDRRRGGRQTRTLLAERLAVACALVALAGMALAFMLGGARPLFPLVAAAPLALVQIAFDSRLQGRRLLPELVGGVAPASLASALMLAGGWSVEASLAAGAVMAGKTAASILYVRARLRLDRGLRPDLRPLPVVHALIVGGAAALAAAGWVPWAATAAAVALTVRAAHGTSRERRIVKPKVLGFEELGYGIAFTLVVVVGYAFGW